MNSTVATALKKPGKDGPASPSKPGASEIALPGGVSELITLFEGELGSVEFPDVSTERLRDAVQAIMQRSEDVARVRSELAQAESSRADAEIALLRLAEKGLAYARVYAAEGSTLSAQLESLKLGTKSDAGRRSRKPRPATHSIEKRRRQASNATAVESDQAEAS